MPDRLQAMIGRELKDLHGAEMVAERLPRHIQDQVAVTHPCSTAAAKTRVGVFGESLVLLGGLLKRRSQELPNCNLRNHDHERRGERGDGKTPHRHAGGADYRQLAAARELPEANERADERGDGKHFPGLLRQAEKHEPQRVECAVMAYADVILLTDEREQRPEHEKNREHEGDRGQDRADDVAVDDRHAGVGLRRRMMRPGA